MDALEAIARLEAEVGAPLSGELRAVLGHTAGIGATRLGDIDFTGRTVEYEDRDVFPSGLPIAGDGKGNFWVLDLTPEETQAAPVFFACHDPPVVLYERAGLGGFLDDVLLADASSVDDRRRERVSAIWRANPATLDQAEAVARGGELRAFADELGERFTFVDLRGAEPGRGFAWGRYGPRTDVRRHGYERLFAYGPPERKAGMLSRLFGRSSPG